MDCDLQKLETVRPAQRLSAAATTWYLLWMLLCAASWSLAAPQNQQPQSKSPAGSAGGKAAPDHDAGSFEYYDKPEYRPGEVNASRDPGGYSAPAYADSYSLILDYVESETAAEAPNHRLGGEKSADRQDGGGTPQEAKSGTPALEGWNEKQFLSRGSSLLLHREFAPATEVFRRGVERFPESVKLEMGLGIALYARGQYDEAVGVLASATDLNPSDPRPYLVLGKAYSRSRSQSDEVRKRLERLVKLDPQNAQARYYYALSLWKGSRTGQSDTSRGQVESLLKSALALDPHFADGHLELGALYAEQAQYGEAITEYRQAIKLKPDLAAAHYRLAQAYARTGDKAASQTEFALYERLRRREAAQQAQPSKDPGTDKDQ